MWRREVSMEKADRTPKWSHISSQQSHVGRGISHRDQIARRSTFVVRPCLWHHRRMTPVLLVARLHVDLQRVVSAACPLS